MREPIKSTFDLSLVAMGVLTGFVLNVSLFNSHIRQALAFNRYRPIYLHSGRRNGVRYSPGLQEKS